MSRPPRRFPRHLTLLVLACGALLAGPWAAHGEEAAAPVRGGPMTAIAAGPLGRSALVVVGRVREVRGDRGIQIATLDVERVVRGQLPPGELTIVSGGPRPTNDPQAPSAPYLRDGDRRRLVFFLTQAPDGVALRLGTLYEAEGVVGEEKTRALVEHAALMGIPDPEARARATLAWLLEAQGAGGRWTRVHAARELNYLARRRPDVFDAATRKTLEAAARTSRLAPQRTWLCRLLASLACLPADLASAAPPVRPELKALQEALDQAEDEDGRLGVYASALASGAEGAVALVLDAAADEDGSVQVAVVDLLVRRGRADAVGPLEARYSRAIEGEVHAAIVRAVGLLGGPADVPWLLGRLTNGRIRRETMFALARIRTPEAVAALERVRDEGKDAPGAGDIVPLADYLLSRAFIEVERAEGRAVGEARGR